MCLPPGPPERLVPPSAKSRELADYFLAVVWENVALSCLLVLVGDWYWATYGLVGALIGRLAVSRETYSVRQAIFFAVWTAMATVFALYHASLYYGGTSDNSPVEPWGFYLYNFVMAGQIVFYALAAVVTYAFLKELRKDQAEYLAANPDPVEGEAPAGASSAFRAPSAASQQQAQQQQQQSAPAAAAPSSFRAFSGSGHRLG